MSSGSRFTRRVYFRRERGERENRREKRKKKKRKIEEAGGREVARRGTTTTTRRGITATQKTHFKGCPRYFISACLRLVARGKKDRGFEFAVAWNGRVHGNRRGFLRLPWDTVNRFREKFSPTRTGRKSSQNDRIGRNSDNCSLTLDYRFS